VNASIVETSIVPEPVTQSQVQQLDTGVTLSTEPIGTDSSCTQQQGRQYLYNWMEIISSVILYFLRAHKLPPQDAAQISGRTSAGTAEITRQGRAVARTQTVQPVIQRVIAVKQYPFPTIWIIVVRMVWVQSSRGGVERPEKNVVPPKLCPVLVFHAYLHATHWPSRFLLGRPPTGAAVR
jgi:hypothetical protein